MSTATTQRLRLSDLSGQRRYAADLTGEGELTPRHSVKQAVEHYLERMEISSEGVGRWAAISRGVRLNDDTTLDELEETDNDWLVVPEVSAGCR